MAKPTLAVNLETLEKLRGDQTWEALANQIGVDPSSLSRIRNGKAQISPDFIAAAVTNMPIRMDELVTVVAA